MPYKIRQLEQLDRWLETNPPVEVRTRVTTWLFELAKNPEGVDATPVPLAAGLPLWTAIVPGTDVAVTWVLIKSPPYPEDQASIMLRKIDSIDA